MIEVKRALLLTLSLLLLSLTACHKAKPKGEKREAPHGKVVVITDSLLLHRVTDTLRLGRMHTGEQLSYRFWLHNQASSPQVVLGHEITCGCISLHYENKPVMPNEYLPVELRFDSRGLYGWQLKLFRLQLHKAAAPLTLYVEAECE